MAARRRQRRPKSVPTPAAQPSHSTRSSPTDTSPEAGALHLQRLAGNRAAASVAAVNRDASQALDLSPRKAASLRMRPELLLPDPIPAKVRAQILSWLESHKLDITIRVDEGAISMPEVIADVREAVAGAADVEPFQVKQLVDEVMGRYAPPATRGKQTQRGQESELAARLANVLGRKVQVGGDSGRLVLSLSGVVAGAKAAGVGVGAEAGTGGIKGTVDIKGRVKATATPSSFALKTSIPMGSATGVFAAKLSKSEGSWSKWSASFSFPVVGNKPVDARPAVDAIRSSVVEAEAAIRDIAAHLHRGGSPTDDYVLKRIGKISPAIKNVGAAVKKPKGPNVTLKVGAGGGPRKVGGQAVQESTIGVSVVVVF